MIDVLADCRTDSKKADRNFSDRPQKL
jgi:hypothetical protein